MNQLIQRIKNADKYTVRGVIYSVIALAGMSYEIFVAHQARLVVLGGYGLILLVGLIFILHLKEKKEL